MLNSCRVCRAQLCPSACLSVCQSVSLPVRMYGCIACIVCIVLVCSVHSMNCINVCMHSCMCALLYAHILYFMIFPCCMYIFAKNLSNTQYSFANNLKRGLPLTSDLGNMTAGKVVIDRIKEGFGVKVHHASRINFTPPVVQRETKRHSVRLGPLLWVVGFLPPSEFSPI